MAVAKPVIAAAHGGLIDIVDDGRTGYLFKPNSALALAESLEKLITNRMQRIDFGVAGRQRQRDLFSIDSQVSAIAGEIEKVTKE
jgi:glycosyltransferase involved in cell wall biosynthesis